MYRLSVEHRFLSDPSSVADNITRHIRDYQVYGRMAVVAQSPDELLGEIKTSWNALKRETKREIEQTTNAEHKERLMYELLYMPQCTFTSVPPIEEPQQKVQVATIEQFIQWPPQCQTMFVTYPVEKAQLHLVTSWMPAYGLVIIYGREREESKLYRC